MQINRKAIEAIKKEGSKGIVAPFRHMAILVKDYAETYKKLRGLQGVIESFSHKLDHERFKLLHKRLHKEGLELCTLGNHAVPRGSCKNYWLTWEYFSEVMKSQVESAAFHRACSACVEAKAISYTPARRNNGWERQIEGKWAKTEDNGEADYTKHTSLPRYVLYNVTGLLKQYDIPGAVQLTMSSTYFPEQVRCGEEQHRLISQMK